MSKLDPVHDSAQPRCPLRMPNEHVTQDLRSVTCPECLANHPARVKLLMAVQDTGDDPYTPKRPVCPVCFCEMPASGVCC